MKKIIKICILLLFVIIVSATAIYWLVPVRIYDDFNLDGKTVKSIELGVVETSMYSKETAEIIAQKLILLHGRRMKVHPYREQNSGGDPQDYMRVYYTDGTSISFVFNWGKDGDICFVRGTRLGRWSYCKYKIYDYQELYDCLGIKKRW